MDFQEKSVLVVDDDHDMVSVLHFFLSNAGFAVLAAYGAESALQSVRVRMPDLVITDLAMPGMSGVQLIEKLKSDPGTDHIPIIAVTAFIWDAIVQAAAAVGCDGFISKPFDSARLLREIDKVLAPDSTPPERLTTISISPHPKRFD
jgi:CheY-like chemotaxis protein